MAHVDPAGVPAITEQAAFGLELQRSRERRGLTLAELADATKIGASLLAGLERGDLSRWPAGIFRRAFVRSYARAVGLAPEETLARFLALYPDTDRPASPGAPRSRPAPSPAALPARLAKEARQPDEQPSVPPPAPAQSPLRLVLDTAAAPADTGRWRRIARRVGAPVVDLLIAGVPGLIAGLAFGWPWFWTVAATVAAVGHVVMLSFAGVTPGEWLLLGRTPSAPRSPARRRFDAHDSTASIGRTRPLRYRLASRRAGTSHTRQAPR